VFVLNSCLQSGHIISAMSGEGAACPQLGNNQIRPILRSG
jgi:hypothetical protein